jgi:hypothetical protein
MRQQHHSETATAGGQLLTFYKHLFWTRVIQQEFPSKGISIRVSARNVEEAWKVQEAFRKYQGNSSGTLCPRATAMARPARVAFALGLTSPTFSFM